MTSAQVASSSPHIVAEGLKRHFGGAGTALSFGRIEIPRGGIVALIGTSGVGKTTLLNILAGIDPTDATEGAYAKLYPGSGAAPINLLDWVRYPRHLVSSIFQRGFLLRNASIGMNIEIPMELAGRRPAPAEPEGFLVQAGLSPEEAAEIIHRRPNQISGGQQQRVGIARAVARDPSVIFADEPTSNLDERARDQVIEVLNAWRTGDPDRTLVLVTHDLDLVADCATHVLLMEAVGEHAEKRDISIREIAAGEGVDFYRNALWPTDPARRVPSVSIADPSAAFGDDDSSRFERCAAQPALSIARQLAQSELYRIGRKGPRLSGFTRWVEACITLLSILVTTAMGVALLANVERLEAVVSDPSNCSLEVTPIRTGEGRTRIGDPELADLATRPWRDVPQSPASDAETQAAGGCQTGPAAFARHDVTQVFLNPVDANSQCSRQSLGVALLSTVRDDPVLESSRVLSAPDAMLVRPGATLADTFADPLVQGRNFVFLSADMVERMAAAGMDPAPNHVCIARGGGAPQRFGVGGIVDRLPAPRLRAFEVMMPESAYLQLAFAGRPPNSIPALQLYFDPGGLFDDGEADDLATYLDGRFGFRLDDIDKTVRLRNEARVSVLALAALAVFNFLLFLGLTYSITLNYMRANAPQLAVLRTFGLRFGTAMLQNFLILFNSLLITMLPLGVIVATLAPYLPIGFGEEVEITIIDVGLMLALVVTINGLVALCAAALATRSWWESGRLLSEVIE